MVSYFNKKVNEYLKKWETVFRKEIRKNEYDPLYCLYCDDISKKEWRKNAEAILGDQLNFIQKMVWNLADNTENLNMVKRFLSYQHLDRRYFPGHREPAFNLLFHGSIYVPGVRMVNFEHLYEFSFSIAWEKLQFNIMVISNNRWKTWTKKRINTVFEYIKRNLEHSWIPVEITIDSGKPGMRGGCLCLNFQEKE